MTAAVAARSVVPLLADGERERVRRAGKKLSSIFSNRNVFVLRKKLRSSSLSATVQSASSSSASVPSKPSSTRSSSTNLSASCHSALSDCDHCSTSNSRLSTSPLSPHSAWSDDDSEAEVDEEDDIDELQSAATMSDEDEQRDVVSPPSSSCSFSSSSSSSSSGSSSSAFSSSSAASLSPLPTLISPRASSSQRRRRTHSKESSAEQKEAHASPLPPPSPIVALPPLHPHALTHTYAALPLAHLHALAASTPSVVGTPPSSHRQHQQQLSKHGSPTQTPPPSASASSPVKGGKHHRSHSASNQFILLQGGANGLSPSARSPTTPQSTFVSPVQTSPFTSPLPSPHLQPAPFSPHHQHHQQHQLHQQYQHQHKHHHHQHQHHQQQHHHQQYRQPPPSPLVFSSPSSRSAPHFASPLHYPTSPFLFMSQQQQQQQQSLSSPPSPTPTAAVQPPTSPMPTALQYVDGQAAGLYMPSATVLPPATALHSAVSASLPSSSSAAHHPSTFARPVLTRAASMLDTSSGSLLHPHPRRSSLLDLAALESSQAHSSKPRSVSSAATFPSFESLNAHLLEQTTSTYPSHTEVHRLLATPLAALLGLTESEPSRSHVPKALARCVQARSSPQVAATSSLTSTPSSAVELPTEAEPSCLAVPSPLLLHRELPLSVPPSPASYANVAAALPRRLSISSSTSSASSSGSPNVSERERRLSSASTSVSLPSSPAVRPTSVLSNVALRGLSSPSRLLPSAQTVADCIDSSSTSAPATPLFVPSSRQTSRSKPSVGSDKAADGSRWLTRTQNSKKQRVRAAKQQPALPPTQQAEQTATVSDIAVISTTSETTANVHNEDCAVEVTAASHSDGATCAADAEVALVQQELPEASPVILGKVVEQVQMVPVAVTVDTCQMVLSTAVPVACDEVTLPSTVGSSKTQPEKKLRPARANRRRASSNASQSPAFNETRNAVKVNCAPIKSSLACRSWSIRFSVMALHSSLLSAISSLSASASAAASQLWGSVCTFYHSLFSSSATRRRFVSRLRSLSHSTQQQQQPQQSAQQQPVVARQSHSLRYRHHPLLERQKLTKDNQPALSMAMVDDVEPLLPRGMVLVMVLCCMFLGTVGLTFVVFHRELRSE